MIKMMMAIRRRPDLTRAECLHHAEHVHGMLAREYSVTLRRYVQNHVFDGAACARDVDPRTHPADRDFISELWFDDAESMARNFGDPRVREKIGGDGRNFALEKATLAAVYREEELAVPNPGTGTLKVIQFLRRAEGVSREAFFERWQAAHHRTLEEDATLVRQLRRCVHNKQTPEGAALLAYFNAKEALSYEGVAQLWLDGQAQLELFRSYERRMHARNDGAERFYAPEDSFFVYTHERCLIS
jgi:hypothetical protein